MGLNSIVIFSDDEITGKALRVKLSSMREVNSIKISPWKDAIFEIESNIPEVVIVYVENSYDETFNFIKSIKPSADALNTQILLITKNLSEEVIVKGFDVGVDDFVPANHSAGELLTRVISCMKKNELLRELDAKNNLLSELNVIQPESGFYLKEYAQKVLETEIMSLQKYGTPAVLMVVSADINYKNILNPSVLSIMIKNSTRNKDKIGFCGDDKFYVLLVGADTNGAISAYERMKKELTSEYAISVGACAIDNMTFEEVNKNVLKSVNEALELGNTIVVYDPKETIEPMNWLDNENLGQRNFKFFQAAFLKKLENVITPVFYQTQKIWEERLFNTKIEQSSDEGQSLFILKTDKNDSILKITYPGFAKVNIDIVHNFEGLDPQERISLDLNELDDTKLGEILVNFIKEFQNYTKEID